MSLTCHHRECQGHDEPTYQAFALCARHFHRLKHDVDRIDQVLTWIAADDDWLLHTTGNDRSSRGKRAHSPAPGRIDVISATDLRAAEALCIIGWAKDVTDTERAIGLVDAAHILVANAERLATHPAVDDICDELSSCRIVVDALADEHWHTAEMDKRNPNRVIGPCNADDPYRPDQPCGGPLRWQDASLTVVCGRCGDTWILADISHIGRVIDLFLPPDVVASLAGVTRRTLNRRIARGLIRRRRGTISYSDATREETT